MPTAPPARSSGGAPRTARARQRREVLGRAVALVWREAVRRIDGGRARPASRRARSWRGSTPPRSTATSRSPLTIALRAHGERRAAGCRRSSASSGATASAVDRAPHREQRRLQDVERVDLVDVGRARPPTRARASRISTASRSRAAASAASNRAGRAIGRAGSRITAAATTGPASGPRPASSTPAIEHRASQHATPAARSSAATASAASAPVSAASDAAKPANSASSRRRVTVSS